MTLKIRTMDFDMRTTLELLTPEVTQLILEVNNVNYDFNRLLNQIGFYQVETNKLLKTYKRN